MTGSGHMEARSSRLEVGDLRENQGQREVRPGCRGSGWERDAGGHSSAECHKIRPGKSRLRELSANQGSHESTRPLNLTINNINFNVINQQAKLLLHMRPVGHPYGEVSPRETRKDICKNGLQGQCCL